MKRLTERLEDGQAIMDCTGCPESWNTNPVGKCTALYCRNMLKDRLAAIEDILGDEYDLDRLRELAEADREGRCVVLPRLKPGQGDNPGEPGVPGPPGIAAEAALKAREQE